MLYSERFTRVRLLAIMEQMNMKCKSLVSYSITVNDEPDGLFTPSRRIRLGNPLSPYIFLFFKV